MVRSSEVPWRVPGRLPRRLRAELTRRREELVASLTASSPGLVCDLATVAVSPARLADGVHEVVPGEGAPLLLVGVSVLARSADPAALLAEARARLAPGGRLVLVEPYRPVRAAAMMVRATAPLVRALTGLRVDLPVPALVRDAGFIPATVERFLMPTPILPLRHFCVVVTCPVDGPGSRPAGTSVEVTR